jgi:O-antigen/teichoic acid export membrane protein
MMQRIKSFLLENKTTKQTIVKNTFWLFAGQIFSRLIKAGIIIYAARVLGTQGWGAFSYAFSLAALFTIFIDFGVNAIITRESTRDLSVQQQYFSTALVIKLGMFAAIAGVIVLGSPLFIKQQEVLVLIPLVVLMLGFDSLRDFGAALSRAWERMEIESAVQIFTNLMIVAASFVALRYAPTAYSLSWGYVIGAGLGMLAAFYPFRQYFKGMHKTFSKGLVKKILVSSWTFGMVGLMGAIMLNTDTFMIGWFKSIEDVGYYGAVQRVVQLLYLVPGLIATAFFPSMARLAQEPERLKRVLERGLSLLTMIAVPLSAGGILLARDIVQLLYGGQYLAAVGAFQIMSATFVPAFLSIMFSNALFSLNKERKLLWYVILGVSGNFIFNLLFIPLWGIEGAALSTLLNTAIITLYLIWQLRRDLAFKTLHQIEKIALAAAAMCAALFALRAAGFNLYINVAISMALYAAALLLLKEEGLLEIWERAKSLKKGAL